MTWLPSIPALLFAAVIVLAEPLGAQESAAVPPPQKIQELLELLRDPVVANWLENEAKAKTAAKESTATAASVHQRVEDKLNDGRARLVSALNGFERLGSELETAGSKVRAELAAYGLSRGWPLIAAFIGLGLGSLWIAVRLTRQSWQRISMSPITNMNDRLRIIGGRARIALIRLLAFTAGSLGIFLLFDWPPLVRTSLLGALLTAQGLALAAVLASLLLVPAGPREPQRDELRIIPVDDATARFWFWRISALGGVLALAAVASSVLERVGVSPDSVIAVQYILAAALAAIVLEAIWRDPQAPDEGRWRNFALSMLVILSLGFWTAGMRLLFGLAVLAGLVPFAIAVFEMAVRHATRVVNEADRLMIQSLAIAAAQRGIRAGILLGALWALERSLPSAITGENEQLGRVVTGLFSGAAILIIFDFLWYLTRIFLEHKIAELKLPGTATGVSEIRRQRLGTLLPIAKNFLVIAFAVIAVLMSLSAMGVAIGPLLAGASVIGVAVGFGSQTLVKDVLSGVFYLLDDAFRVGEYIQSGTYKGTVESFTLRSVRLRHHRGPVFTVPFGSLGAIQNMSRDWVLETIVVAVAFDTDLRKVKRLVRQVGEELLADAEIAPHIIETLKMQGVEEFGEYGIRIRLKFIARPGEQADIRRKAYQRIKELFDQNGVKFAVPRVQVAEGEDRLAAAFSRLKPLATPAKPQADGSEAA
jgi:moderate conductance mechanosensitive channel